MALAALIFACRSLRDDDAKLVATLPFAGRSLVEYQIRQAAQAGARHIVVLVERVPAPLISAIDRLRDDGIAVEIARTASDAADRIHPEEMLLAVGDGIAADAESYVAITAATVPSLLTIAHIPATDMFERIDADHRWAGLALLDGARLHATAQMLGEWDLESTLIRCAVQEHAQRLDVLGSDGMVAPVLATTVADLAPFERRAIDGGVRRRDGWPEQWIFPPIERLVVSRLLGRIDDPLWLALGSMACALLSPFFVLLNLPVLAMILLLASGPMLASARRIAAIRLSPLLFRASITIARNAGAAMALLLVGYRLTSGGQWGWMLAAGMAILLLWMTARERGLVSRAGGARLAHWIATADGAIWLFAPFLILRSLGAGIAMLFLYGLASFLMAQKRLADALEKST